MKSFKSILANFINSSFEVLKYSAFGRMTLSSIRDNQLVKLAKAANTHLLVCKRVVVGAGLFAGWQRLCEAMRDSERK